MSTRTGLRWLVAGQFAGALADNALLLVAIAALDERVAPAWAAPGLRVAFYLAFVLMAAHASALSDAWPKKRVVVATHLLRVAGCGLLACGAHPLWAYAVVGAGAAAHAPARYGILAELAVPGTLVAANAALEAATVAAMLLGTLWGSAMLHGVGLIAGPASGTASRAALTLAAAYLLAAACTLPVRGGAASAPGAWARPGLVGRFHAGLSALWRDPLTRACLLATCTLWGVAAVLQFLVLRWASARLGLALADAGLLQAVIGTGMIAGSLGAGRWVRDRDALAVLPAGALLGAALLLLTTVHALPPTAVLLFAAGALCGLVVVPLNAVVQRRGANLMPPGQAIGAQHWSENVASLAGLAAYGAALALGAALQPTILVLGSVLCIAMAAAAVLGRSLQVAQPTLPPP